MAFAAVRATACAHLGAVAAGQVRVVVGACSALFLPYAELGLIVVDEEHDPAYKQEDGVRYHARDMAVVRATRSGHSDRAGVGDASIESEVNAGSGRYARLHLPERFGGQDLPHIEMIDLRADGPPRGRWIAPRLVALNSRDRVRRAGAAVPQPPRLCTAHACRQCGYRMACPNCDAWLVDHRHRRRLVCHHCGFSPPPPAQCPQCEATESFVAVGPGVERLEQEAVGMFPDARVLELSSDLVESIDRLREELGDVEPDVSTSSSARNSSPKGIHFPKLNLVGVIDADLGLANGDPRAAERTFQLLHQVVGRAGREAGRGKGYLQTYQPDHPVLRALMAADREAFYASEIELREKTGYPPFGRLASLLISAGERPLAEGYARRLARIAPQAAEVQVFGPAEAPLAVIRGRHRFRILVKSPRSFDLSAICAADGGCTQARGKRQARDRR